MILRFITIVLIGVLLWQDTVWAQDMLMRESQLKEVADAADILDCLIVVKRMWRTRLDENEAMLMQWLKNWAEESDDRKLTALVNQVTRIFIDDEGDPYIVFSHSGREVMCRLSSRGDDDDYMVLGEEFDGVASLEGRRLQFVELKNPLGEQIKVLQGLINNFPEYITTEEELLEAVLEKIPVCLQPIFMEYYHKCSDFGMAGVVARFIDNLFYRDMGRGREPGFKEQLAFSEGVSREEADGAIEVLARNFGDLDDGKENKGLSKELISVSEKLKALYKKFIDRFPLMAVPYSEFCHNFLTPEVTQKGLTEIGGNDSPEAQFARDCQKVLSGITIGELMALQREDEFTAKSIRESQLALGIDAFNLRVMVRGLFCIGKPMHSRNSQRGLWSATACCCVCSIVNVAIIVLAILCIIPVLLILFNPAIACDDPVSDSGTGGGHHSKPDLGDYRLYPGAEARLFTEPMGEQGLKKSEEIAAKEERKRLENLKKQQPEEGIKFSIWLKRLSEEEKTKYKAIKNFYHSKKKGYDSFLSAADLSAGLNKKDFFKKAIRDDRLWYLAAGWVELDKKVQHKLTVDLSFVRSLDTASARLFYLFANHFRCNSWDYPIEVASSMCTIAGLRDLFQKEKVVSAGRNLGNLTFAKLLLLKKNIKAMHSVKVIQFLFNNIDENDTMYYLNIRRVVRLMDFVDFDKDGRLVFCLGSSGERILLKGITPENFLNKFLSLDGYVGNFYLDVLEGLGEMPISRRKAYLQGLKNLNYADLLDIGLFRTAQLWKGPDAVLEKVLERLSKYSEDFVSLRVFGFIPVRDKRIVYKYLDRINQIKKIANKKLKVRATKDFQSAVYLLGLMVQNKMISEDKGGELFAELVQVELPKRTADDVYQRWVRQRLAHAIRDSFASWDLQVPAFVSGEKDKRALRWSDVCWQDVLVRGLIGVNFQDRYYVPARVRFERIRRILLKQHAIENRAGDYLFYLAYAWHLSLFPDDLVGIVLPGLAEKHDFLNNSWSNGSARMYFGPREWKITGHISTLSSETGHIYRKLIEYKKNKEEREYEYFILKGEIEDRFCVLALGKISPYLRDSEVKEYVSQTVALGRLLAEDKKEMKAMESTLRKVVDTGKYKNINVLYQAGKVKEAAGLLTTSELYYLGKSVLNAPGRLRSSFPYKRLTSLQERMGRAGVFEADFQKEIDAVVGIYSFNSKGIDMISDVQMEPYMRYMESHDRAERYSVDFILQLVTASPEGVAVSAQPFLIMKAFRYLYENGDARKGIIENIRMITPARVKQWINELMQEGIIKKGCPMDGGKKGSINGVYNGNIRIGEIALRLQGEERIVSREQVPDLDLAVSFVLPFILGLLKRQDASKELSTRVNGILSESSVVPNNSAVATPGMYTKEQHRKMNERISAVVQGLKASKVKDVRLEVWNSLDEETRKALVEVRLFLLPPENPQYPHYLRTEVINGRLEYQVAHAGSWEGRGRFVYMTQQAFRELPVEIVVRILQREMRLAGERYGARQSGDIEKLGRIGGYDSEVKAIIIYSRLPEEYRWLITLDLLCEILSSSNMPKDWPRLRTLISKKADFKLVRKIGTAVEEAAEGTRLTDEEKAYIIEAIAISALMPNKRQRDDKEFIFKKIRDDLDNLGYGRKVGEIIEGLVQIKAKKRMSQTDYSFILTLEEFLGYYKGTISKEMHISQLKGQTTPGVGDLLETMKSNLAQWKVLELAKDKQPKGIIVQDIKDLGPGVQNWLERIKRYNVDMSGVQMAYLIDGISEEERQVLRTKKPPNIILLEEIKGENVAYLARQDRLERYKGKGIKLVERGNAGPVIELGLCLYLLDSDDIGPLNEKLKELGFGEGVIIEGEYRRLPRIEKALEMWNELEKGCIYLDIWA